MRCLPFFGTVGLPYRVISYLRRYDLIQDGTLPKLNLVISISNLSTAPTHSPKSSCISLHCRAFACESDDIKGFESRF